MGKRDSFPDFGDPVHPLFLWREILSFLHSLQHQGHAGSVLSDFFSVSFHQQV